MNKEEYFERNKRKWEEEVTKTKLFYPDESVVRYIASRKGKSADGARKTILDFGCGAGRHSIAMLRMGYEVIGVDYNEKSLEVTKERVAQLEEELNTKLEFKGISNLNSDIPIKNETVDTIVAWGSMFYNERAKIKELLKEMYRVLKENGELFADFRTQRDYLYGCGEEIEKDFYQLDESSGRPGYIYLFLPLEEWKEIFKECGFEVINVETFEFTQDNGKNLNSWYHITAKKTAGI